MSSASSSSNVLATNKRRSKQAGLPLPPSCACFNLLSAVFFWHPLLSLSLPLSQFFEDHVTSHRSFFLPFRTPRFSFVYIPITLYLSLSFLSLIVIATCMHWNRRQVIKREREQNRLVVCCCTPGNRSRFYMPVVVCRKQESFKWTTSFKPARARTLTTAGPAGPQASTARVHVCLSGRQADLTDF